MKQTRHSNLYILSDRDYVIMKKRSSTFPNCYYCTLPIWIGDKVFSKLGSSGNTRHYYHEMCSRIVKLI